MIENYVDKHYLSRNKIKILFVYFLLIVLTLKNIYERREFSKIHIAPLRCVQHVSRNKTKTLFLTK